jgi:homoserine kinase type II
MSKKEAKNQANNLKSLVQKYSIGSLESYRSLQAGKTVQGTTPAFFLKTTKGAFFVKCYGEMSYISKKGVELVEFLRKHKYPVPEIIHSKKGKTSVSWQDGKAVIYKWVGGRSRYWVDSKEAFMVGYQLARLHVIAKKFPLRKTFDGYQDITTLFKSNVRKLEKPPAKLKKAILYCREMMPKLKFSRSQPTSVCHGEFWWEHLYFKNKKLIAVIDWDSVSREVMLYDLGCTMNLAHGNGFDMKIIGNVVEGYNKKRKLTSWEKEHLFYSLSWGVFKAFTWSILPKNVKRRGWPTVDLKRVQDLQNLEKKRFDEEIKKYL